MAKKSNATEGPLDFAQVVELNGKRFVAGLLWQPISSPAEMRREMSEFALAERKNLGTVYAGPSSIQAGYMYAGAGQMKLFSGAYSLASVLASELTSTDVSSWIGVWGLEGGRYIFVAVRDGLILPGCDSIGSYDETAQSFREFAHVHSWARAYVADPTLRAELGFEDEYLDASPLASLVARKKYDKSAKLARIQVGFDKRLIALAVLLALGLGGLYLYNHNRAVQRQIARTVSAKQALKLKAFKKERSHEDALAEVRRNTEMPPWVKEPRAQAVLDACRQTIAVMPLSIAAWPAQSATCDEKGVVVNYASTLKGTTVGDFNAALVALKAAGGIESFIVDPAKGSVRIPIEHFTARGVEPVSNYQDWLIAWSSRMQAQGLTSTIKLLPHPRPKPPSKLAIDELGKAGATPRAPWWNSYSWEVLSKSVAPWDALSGASPSGFVFDQLSIDTRDSKLWKWTVKGKIYVKQ